MINHTTSTVEETFQLAQKITTQILREEIPSTLLLSGDLGGGKTTFTQGIGQALGITRPLVSPTYTIIRPYDIPEQTDSPFKRLIHTDLYRIKAPWEAEEFELAQYASHPETILVVEWPEKAAQLWSRIPHTQIHFSVPSPNQRIIQITSH